MAISGAIDTPARLPKVAVEFASPHDRETDQALAMQDAAARTGENAPRAGQQLRDLPSPIDRFVERAD